MSDPAQSSQDYSLLELAVPLRDEESFSINFICGMNGVICSARVSLQQIAVILLPALTIRRMIHVSPSRGNIFLDL